MGAYFDQNQAFMLHPKTILFQYAQAPADDSFAEKIALSPTIHSIRDGNGYEAIHREKGGPLSSIDHKFDPIPQDRM